MDNAENHVATEAPKPDKKGGSRSNKNKLRWSLLAWPALRVVAKVGTMGGMKYDDFNWLKGLSYNETYDCMLRHADKWFTRGQRFDKESGLHHLGHAAWNALALLTMDLLGLGKDDRFPYWDYAERVNITKGTFFEDKDEIIE
jgi:hypothetical protein